MNRETTDGVPRVVYLRSDGGNAQGALGPPVVLWIGVADNMGVTSDGWDVFVAHEAKVEPEFEGNVLDLGCVLFLVCLSLTTTLPLFRFPACSSRSRFRVLPSVGWSDHVQVLGRTKASHR